MNTLDVQTSTNTYRVYIGSNLRKNLTNYLPKSYKNVMVITDSEIEKHYLQDVIEGFPADTKVSFSVVPNGEASKSSEQYFNLLTNAIENGLDRKSLIVALGGGMIGDLAGFVAATFMRGIDYVQVPTSILAHDSSVGGKVAINHPEGKNLIGSFFPPQAVVYDVDTLFTLPQREIRSGYAEVVKHGLISDNSFFEEVVATDLTTDLKPEVLTRHLQKGIAVKAKIVENDEKESNERKFLNFGHTLAHALEAELGYGKLTHGEAVAIGMLFAIRVSNKFYQTQLPYQRLYQWLETNNYPLTLPRIDVNVLVNRMKKDKKSENAKVQMVLLREVGNPTLEQVNDEELNSLLEQFLGELVNH
ncbi:3-dehydroquinate synthase [Aquibacillus salsiterrae]|uniref:3-dehydroquinate synthase n=1 Tax=Aquibacillus salsiterrae TaxID=2950439 RepID=A0A9X4AEP0_9BACI|nr:3-dehydroquinate synthase [Aquibacillus salsiterrae]MDC3415375.1 3-dehydroquinate synthase [Aquibacillus salsiterrae]